MGETIFEEARETKVYDSVDVLVCGGGTSGIFAALASARHGADTLLIEQEGFLAVYRDRWRCVIVRNEQRRIGCGRYHEPCGIIEDG